MQQNRTSAHPPLSTPNPRARFSGPRRAGPHDALRPVHWQAPLDQKATRAWRREHRTRGAVRSASYFAASNGSARISWDEFEAAVGENQAWVWAAIEGLRDEHQRVWLRVGTIAKRVGKSDRSVQRSLDILRAFGMIVDVGKVRVAGSPHHAYARVVVGRLCGRGDRVAVTSAVAAAVAARKRARVEKARARRQRAEDRAASLDADEVACRRVRGRLRAALRRWEERGALPAETIPGVAWAPLFAALGPRPPGGHLVPAKPWRAVRWSRPTEAAAALAPGQLRWGTLAESRAAGRVDASGTGGSTRSLSGAQSNNQEKGSGFGFVNKTPAPAAAGSPSFSRDENRTDARAEMKSGTRRGKGKAMDARTPPQPNPSLGVSSSSSCARPVRGPSPYVSMVPSMPRLSSTASPPMPSVTEDMPDENRARLLASAYRCALGRDTGKRCHVLRRGAIERSKPYDKLVAAAAKLLEHGIQPHAWARFSVDQWRHANGHRRNPPIAWVYNVDRIRRWRGWCRKEARGFGGEGGQVRTNTAELALFMARQRAVDALHTRQPETADEARAIVAEFFTPDSWEAGVRRAGEEAERLRDDIDDDMRDEVWVWS